MPLPQALALGQDLEQCTEGCSRKNRRKAAHAGSRDLRQARQVCGCTRQWMCTAELDQWSEHSSYVCCILLCFASVFCWMGVFILRRNFEHKHLILEASAVLGNYIRKKCRNAYVSLQNFIVIILTQSVHWVTLKLNSFRAGLQKSVSLEKNCCGKYRVNLIMPLTRIDGKCKNLRTLSENPVPRDKEGLQKGV